MIVGKSPQHPTTHNLYRAEDLNGYLRSAPLHPAARPHLICTDRPGRPGSAVAAATITSWWAGCEA